MSHDGKMRRGAKWYRFRDADGVLNKDVSEDPNKMSDVNYYLENSKKPEVKETKPKKEK